MGKLKLIVDDDVKQHLDEILEKLGDRRLGDQKLAKVYAGDGCGAVCKVTCSYWCRATCEVGCTTDCSHSCSGECTAGMGSVGGGCTSYLIWVE